MEFGWGTVEVTGGSEAQTLMYYTPPFPLRNCEDVIGIAITYVIFGTNKFQI